MTEQRLTFGTDANLYDRVRPAYEDRVVDDVVALVGGGTGHRVLDVGCGTGKATIMLADRGLVGVGVEPDPKMAAIAAAKLVDRSGWRVDVDDFEHWDPRIGDMPFDLITVAQAWHWINRDEGAKQAERLLRSGGWLTIFGDVPSGGNAPIRQEIDAIYAELAPAPPARDRAPKQKLPGGRAFGVPMERNYPGFRDYTADQWIDLMRTSSDHKLLAEDVREEIFSRIRHVIDAHGGTFRDHFVCTLWAAQRT